MSGVELIGAISGIVAILDTAVKVYGAVKDAAGLPSSFHTVAQRLPLVLDTLRTARDGIKLNSTDKDSSASMMLVLDSCEKKALSLQKIFRSMAPKPGDSTPRRVATALHSLGKGKKIDGLMQGIIDDIQLMAGSHALNPYARGKIADFTETIEQGPVPMALRRTDYSPRLSISNYGGASQNIHSGTGDQFINTSGAPQFHGTFTGAFSFPSLGTTPSSPTPGTPHSFISTGGWKNSRPGSPPPWSPWP